MKAFLCIFTALWALITTVHAAPQPIPDPFLGFNAMGWSAKILAYCNRGWGGDGGCEAKGYCMTAECLAQIVDADDSITDTFCCKQDYGGQFVHSKFVSNRLH